jgi:hypothetical protein
VLKYSFVLILSKTAFSSFPTKLSDYVSRRVGETCEYAKRTSAMFAKELFSIFIRIEGYKALRTSWLIFETLFADPKLTISSSPSYSLTNKAGVKSGKLDYAARTP